MTTHLYCLLPPTAEARAPRVRGIGGEPVRALDAGAVTAWVGTVAEGAPADAAAVRAHDGVATAALAVATPLPARFGQRFPSDEACRDALAPRATALAARLAEVEGCAEMRVVLVPPALPAPRPDTPAGAGVSGRAYLEGLRTRVHGERALHERADALRSALSRAAGALARREAAAVHPGTAAPIAVAHLVRRGDERAWRGAIDAALPLARREGERLLVAGPVAPYTFTEGLDVGPDE